MKGRKFKLFVEALDCKIDVNNIFTPMDPSLNMRLYKLLDLLFLCKYGWCFTVQSYSFLSFVSIGFFNSLKNCLFLLLTSRVRDSRKLDLLKYVSK